MIRPELPEKEGLYDPMFERDACGFGFIAKLGGEKSHRIVEQGLEILVNLAHRGGAGADVETGDGAGILVQIPDRFFRTTAQLGFDLPAQGQYAAGLVFLSQDRTAREAQIQILNQAIVAAGQRLLGWRDVPTAPNQIGALARESMPCIRQIFVAAAPGLDQLAFERRLYVLRRIAENQVRDQCGAEAVCFHLPSLSSRTLIYKGLMLAHQVSEFYPDLADPHFESAIAMVHQRYSTNTFPTWDLAQPFRFIAHNGEINTLRGNVNWMHARQGTLKTDAYGADLEKIFPVIRERGSDSAKFDNVFEFLFLSGRELEHAILTMIPEAWEGHAKMAEDRRAFFEYHACLMEPWDGPAAMVFSDGQRVGAVLDRNGLRPSRYTLTKDGFVIAASESGVLQTPPENVVRNGRLQPGRIFMVDVEAGRIIDDGELKQRLIDRKPYRKWLAENRLHLNQLPPVEAPIVPNRETLLARQQAFGYSIEDLKLLIAPMVTKGEEAIGSMGDDTALAVLSDRPRLLYSYFKQLFAQVTNPAIDSIRERLVMSTYSNLGSEKNLLEETPEHAQLLWLDQPVLTDEELEQIHQIAKPGFRAQKISMLFKRSEGAAGLAVALDHLCAQASQAIARGVNILILTDREMGPDLVAIPTLLATSAVHHHLIRTSSRTKCGIVVESGEAREVGHFALLIGYGACAVNPYLAFESIERLIEQGIDVPNDLSPKLARKNYCKAVEKGLLKIFAKMGVSTLQSYRGAQLFEAVGLDHDLIEKYFTGTASRVRGAGIEVIAKESMLRHERAFPGETFLYPELDSGGLYKWRARGERHHFSPTVIAKLQHAVRSDDYKTFQEYSSAADGDTKTACTLRGLFKLKLAEKAIAIEEVEPVSAIVKRFCTGAMSYGSISLEAHQSLAIAMNRLGGRSNTGEGGEDPERFTRDANGDLRRSAIKQVASGRFGVTSWYLVNADEMQIKIAQGAKPGEGGQLPGYKVDEAIAKTRHSTPGVGLISPPPHHDIYSIEDLAQLIYDLKNANRDATVSVKLVSETGVGTVAAGVAKGKADLVLISGHDGGTGASPQTSIKYAGVPWEIGLAEAQQTLVKNDLRGRIRVQTDGGLKTGRDVVIAALLGADEFGFATAPLVTLGCIMMRACHLNTCPVGIATQNTELRKKFQGKPEYVLRFFEFIAQEVREWMARLGYRTVDEMIGQVHRLDVVDALDHWKARGLDFSEILHEPRAGFARRHVSKQDHGLEQALDHQLMELAKPALEGGAPVAIHLPIRNVHRTVGTMLGSEVSRRYGIDGLPEDTIRISLRGSAGQSLGAWLPGGVTITVEGDANDHVGKGLSGGRIIVRLPETSKLKAHENIIIGNVALYGATRGEAFFHGVAGERFCVRNSGAHAVVEGVGDHGCEYMTGGRVVILGATGRNFAAGMSGGIAYVLDETGEFPSLCNLDDVGLEMLDIADAELVQRMVRKHFQATRSERADEVLRKWETYAPKFVKVMPQDYKRALLQHAEKKESAGGFHG